MIEKGLHKVKPFRMDARSIKIDDDEQNAQEYNIKQAYKKVEQDMAK